MAVAVEVLDDRHAGFAGDAFDQALAAAGDDDVHELGHGDEFANRRAVGGVDDLDGRFGQAGGGEAGAHAFSDGLVGVQGFLAATQDGRIA